MAKISLYGKFFWSDLAGMRMGRYSIKGMQLRGITMALAKSIISMGRLSAKGGIRMEVSIFFLWQLGLHGENVRIYDFHGKLAYSGEMCEGKTVDGRSMINFL